MGSFYKTGTKRSTWPEGGWGIRGRGIGILNEKGGEIGF